MKKQDFKFRTVALAAALAIPMTAAMATNGYMPHGYGIKAKGMGGASVAMTDNAFAGANNPAIAAWSGNRGEIGLDFFSPKRTVERTGSGGFGAGSLDASVESESNLFLVPEFGYNMALGDKMGVGITVYGNGGMNTNYPGGQLNCGAGPATANMLCGAGNLGVDLMQLIFAPTFAYKLNERHSVGVSPLLVYQQFKAYGLDAFDNAPGFPPFTSAPGKVNSGNYEQSTGVGLRLGYLGKISEVISVGAAYSPKISMSKLDAYAGLFAGAGGFDIPENYALGASFQASPSVIVAVDYARTNYSGVPSISNPSSNALTSQLGNADGAGFGWKDVSAWKVGVQWQAAPQWLLRAGLNFGDNPVGSQDVSMNILAPGVITKHMTVGGTYALSPTSEVSFSYMYAPSSSVTGTSFFNNLGAGAGGTETVKMSQQSFGIQYGWRF
jgi:long-chain fatty acid transport protein